jgi:Holliday junction resolvase RusA-like endonuclease
MPFLITIPIPPSVNDLYGVGKGGRRYLKRHVKAWREEAGWMLKDQDPVPVTGRYKLFLSVPKTRKDADNMLKPTLDLLVSLGLTPDDRHCECCLSKVDHELRNYATVSVEEA